MLLPYRVNTLMMRTPWANIALIAVNVLVFFLMASGAIPKEVRWGLVLRDWSPIGFIGYQFIHADILHLAGNMMLLWVFGNALNGIMHHVDYVLAYLAMGVVAGALHLIIDGAPVVGASGAVSGLMGMYLAVYPKNEVSCFYWILKTGTFELKGYWLIIGWFSWDLFSAIRGVPGVACWAHVGGTLAGFAIGLLLLKMGRIALNDEYDNPTMLDLFARERE
jgi:membrane associated rhomboid family serine protease